VSVPITSNTELYCFRYVGMRVFSKYSPKDVPKVLLYDANLGILVSEWLEQYIPLSHFFGFTPIVSEGKVNVPHLEVDSDTCRAMGTIMGRSHARTHKCDLTSLLNWLIQHSISLSWHYIISLISIGWLFSFLSFLLSLSFFFISQTYPNLDSVQPFV
jgi:hypothetical protein